MSCLRGGGFDEDVGARGQSERTDSTGLDVGAPLEPPDRGVDVAAPRPAVGIRIALTAAAATGVVEQHPIPGAREHRGMRAGTVAVAPAAVDDDDRGAVAGRDIPPREQEPVAGAEAHVLVRDREAPDRRTELVRGPQRRADRCHHIEQGQRRQHDRDRPVDPAAAAVRATPTLTPGDPHGHRGQREAGGQQQETAPIAAGDGPRAGVAERDHPGHHAEDPEGERNAGPQPGTEPWIGECRSECDGDRHETGDEVVPDRGPRLPLHELVIDDVQNDQCDRRREDPELRDADARDDNRGRSFRKNCGVHHFNRLPLRRVSMTVGVVMAVRA